MPREAKAARGVPPPGFVLHVREAKSRAYTVVISPSGVAFPSCAAAWRFFNSRGSSSAFGGVCSGDGVCRAVGVCPGGGGVPFCSSSFSPTPAGAEPISEALVSALQACELTSSCLPSGVVSCMAAAFDPGVPVLLRQYSLEYVDLFGPDIFAVAVVVEVQPMPAPPPGPSDAKSLQLRQITALRGVLPEGCERVMLGSEHSVRQASPSMCEEALMAKFVASAGPQGGAAARDRRDLIRYISFCKSHARPPFFPVGSIVFPCFLKDAVRNSNGSKGGATVEYSIKTSFMHMKVNYGLPVDFEAPVMFNVIKPYHGDSDAASSPTQFMVDEWERLAMEGQCEVDRLASIVAVLATWLTLRASHFVGATVHADATSSRVILNLARDKDGSSNVWAGCDAAGQRGPFLFWPDFMAAARARGFLIPELKLPASFGTSADPVLGDAAEPVSLPYSDRATVLWDTPVTSSGLKAYFMLAFYLAGVPLARQRAEHFTGHSPRHFLPCFAEMLMWLQKFVDEIGRWATGAANAKKTKCGPRYTAMANRVMQWHLRTRLRAVLVALRPTMVLGPEGLVPCFSALSMSDVLTGHPYFGPNGVGFIPATFERSVERP